VTFLEYLPENYYDVIRGKLGATDEELTDSDIDNTLAIETTEYYLLKRVPDYQSLDNEVECFHIKSAILNYMSYLMCFIMPRKVFKSVATLDVKWDKFNMDYEKLALKFLSDFESDLMEVTSVTVVDGETPSITGLTSNTRDPMGFVTSTETTTG
jgi:hypothetical protein